MNQAHRTILIVDGSATSVFYMASLLRKLRYSVKTVTTGEDALNTIARSAPTAVITDAVLPKMSGLHLLERMKKTESLRFIPVIINTADETASTREACKKAGCADYFIKPADNESLYRAIQTASEKTPRKNIRINTSLEVRLAGSVTGLSARTEKATSLSEGGLYVDTSAPAPVNTLVPLTLVLGTREIEATAVVLYSSEKAGGMHKTPGMGMKFTNIGAADVSAIREFIRLAVMKDLRH